MARTEGITPTPTQLVVHKQSRILEVAFADGKRFRLPCELLRVYSPSAEVRGHGPGQEVLQVGKREVSIDTIEPVGHYAVQPRFTDGHDSGIFAWDYLYWLGSSQDALWKDYLERLKQAGASRDPEPIAGAPAAAPSSAESSGLQAPSISRPRS